MFRWGHRHSLLYGDAELHDRSSKGSPLHLWLLRQVFSKALIKVKWWYVFVPGSEFIWWQNTRRLKSYANGREILELKTLETPQQGSTMCLPSAVHPGLSSKREQGWNDCQNIIPRPWITKQKKTLWSSTVFRVDVFVVVWNKLVVAVRLKDKRPENASNCAVSSSSQVFSVSYFATPLLCLKWISLPLPRVFYSEVMNRADGYHTYWKPSFISFLYHPSLERISGRYELHLYLLSWGSCNIWAYLSSLGSIGSASLRIQSKF